MGLFSSIGKLGKAAVGTVLLPVDVARDFAAAINEDDADHTVKRGKKIERNLREAIDEIDE